MVFSLSTLPSYSVCFGTLDVPKDRNHLVICDTLNTCCALKGALWQVVDLPHDTISSVFRDRTLPAWKSQNRLRHCFPSFERAEYLIPMTDQLRSTGQASPAADVVRDRLNRQSRTVAGTKQSHSLQPRQRPSTSPTRAPENEWVPSSRVRGSQRFRLPSSFSFHRFCIKILTILPRAVLENNK